MSIYAMSYSWERSQYLTWFLNKSLHALGVPHLIFMNDTECLQSPADQLLDKFGTIIVNKGYYEGGHGGWPDTMHKINGYRIAVETFSIQADDWLLDMDDDTYMCNDSIIKLLTNEVDLVGMKHKAASMSKIGTFGHMSGACVCMRGELLLRLLAQDEQFWERIKQELLDYGFSHMWDVVVSYALISLKAKTLSFTKRIICNASPEDYFSGKRLGDFFHFNFACETFLGEPTPNHKYDIPLVLLKKGLINAD